MDSFPSKRFMTPSGIEIAGDVGGDPEAPPVLLLHGGGQTRHSWGAAMHALVNRGYYVINLDSRGHGTSDWAMDGDYSLDRLAEDLRPVIGGLARLPALIGASMGGAAALYLVGNSHEPLASSLILVDIVPRPDPEGAAKIGNFMAANPDGFADVEAAADAVAIYYPDRPRPKDPSGLLKNLRLHPDGRLHWHWDPMFLLAPRRLEPPSFAERLLAACKGVKVPTLLVRGLKSDVVTDENVREFQHHLPHLEVSDVAGAGHMVAGDRNDAFIAAVVDFLVRHPPLA